MQTPSPGVCTFGFSLPGPPSPFGFVSTAFSFGLPSMQPSLLSSPVWSCHACFCFVWFGWQMNAVSIVKSVRLRCSWEWRCCVFCPAVEGGDREAESPRTNGPATNGTDEVRQGAGHAGSSDILLSTSLLSHVDPLLASSLTRSFLLGFCYPPPL